MPVDVAAALAGLDALAGRLNGATRQVVADAAHVVQANAMVLAPVGTAGNSTNAPGDLRRSIDVQGPLSDGEDTWLARVGPTTVYGRQRELGGDIYPQAASILRFVKFGSVVFTPKVHQVKHPYMLPAREQSLAQIEAMAVARIAAAVEGKA